nr:restriction endonuclease subunit S [Tepidibacter mesophilus]
MNNVISEIAISAPRSLEEQQRISELLASIDNLITLHQRKQKEPEIGLFHSIFKYIKKLL